VDDLQSIATDYLAQRKDEIAKCEAIIHEKAKPLLEQRGPGGFVPSSTAKSHSVT
jgi:glutamyl-tRNA reductase